jgi:hypothetical protein
VRRGAVAPGAGYIYIAAVGATPADPGWTSLPRGEWPAAGSAPSWHPGILEPSSLAM